VAGPQDPKSQNREQHAPGALVGEQLVSLLEAGKLARDPRQSRAGLSGVEPVAREPQHPDSSEPGVTNASAGSLAPGLADRVAKYSSTARRQPSQWP
jgi:hypothetical protein